jgi:hypothetical protein
MEMGMEEKSKLRRLALTRVMLRALPLLLAAPTSAFASTEANQKIGVPQAMDSKAKGCFGVVLSPDGDGFYSVRDGLLTHYLIAPFKKIGSVPIDEAQLKDIPEKTDCRVLITDDGSKLIVVFRDWIVTLDRRTGKMEKKVPRRGELKGPWSLSEAVTLNGNDLVFLRIVSNPSDEGYIYELVVVDARSMEFKSKISDIKRFGFMYTDNSPAFITKIEDRLYLSSGRSLAVLNAKTYAPELALSSPFPAGMAVPIDISKDYRKVYVASGRFVTDHLTDFEKDYGEAVENATAVFDQETRQISFEKTDRSNRPRDQFAPILFHFRQSRNRNYVTVSLREYAGIASRIADTKSFFHQYESGEAILIETRPKGPLLPVWKFQLTPGARQYLMMKNSAGQIVPINDATFAKYHANSTR